MRISRVLSRRSALPVVLIAALALSAFAAASASAATWVQGNTSMKWTATSITLKKNGGSETSCSLAGVTNFPPTGAFHVGGNAVGWVWGGSGENMRVGISCSGGKELEFAARPVAKTKLSEGVYPMEMQNIYAGGCCPLANSPYGSYFQETTTPTFTNGTAETSSTLTFTNAQIGKTSPLNEPITISGTFKISQATGALLSLTG